MARGHRGQAQALDSLVNAASERLGTGGRVVRSKDHFVAK
jgi:hypothetical protein